MTTIETSVTTQFMAAISHMASVESRPVSGSRRSCTSTAMMTMLIRASAKSPFHANSIIWSTRRRGQVALIHSRQKTTRNTFSTNHAWPGTGSKPRQPPRKTAVMTTAVTMGAMNSASWSTANFMPLYSVW